MHFSSSFSVFKKLFKSHYAPVKFILQALHLKDHKLRVMDDIFRYLKLLSQKEHDLLHPRVRIEELQESAK